MQHDEGPIGSRARQSQRAGDRAHALAEPAATRRAAGTREDEVTRFRRAVLQLAESLARDVASVR